MRTNTVYANSYPQEVRAAIYFERPQRKHPEPTGIVVPVL